MKQRALQAGGLRRVAPWAEIGIGGRINVIEGGLNIAPGELGILDGIDVSGSYVWFDPLLMLRLMLPLENK